MYVNATIAKKHYGVSTDTLRRWSKTGKIDFIVTEGKHRRYFVPDFSTTKKSSISDKEDYDTDEEEVEAAPDQRGCQFINDKDRIAVAGTANSRAGLSRKHLIYARVSSHKQKADLQNQLQFLSDRFPNHTAICDIGSGLNYNRKGLQTILDKVFGGNIEEIVVANKDRLARTGFELLENIFDRFGTKLTVIDDDENGKEEKYGEDIMSIINYFTAKYNGRRRYVSKKTNTTDKADKTKNENEKDKPNDIGRVDEPDESTFSHGSNETDRISKPNGSKKSVLSKRFNNLLGSDVTKPKSKSSKSVSVSRLANGTSPSSRKKSTVKR